GLDLLYRLVRLGGRVGGQQIFFLAEQALRDLWCDLPEQRIAAIDVLDRKLPALKFILALHCVGASARHCGRDIDGVTTGAFRPSAERREITDRISGRAECGWQ